MQPIEHSAAMLELEPCPRQCGVDPIACRRKATEWITRSMPWSTNPSLLTNTNANSQLAHPREVDPRLRRGREVHLIGDRRTQRVLARLPEPVCLHVMSRIRCCAVPVGVYGMLSSALCWNRAAHWCGWTGSHAQIACQVANREHVKDRMQCTLVLAPYRAQN